MAKVKRTPPTKITKTMHRGLRPYPSPSLDKGFPQKEIEKMAERLERILTNCRVLDEEDQWIVDQVFLAAFFRQAISNEEKNKITEEIRRQRAKGHRLGFSETEMGAINRVVAQEDQAGQLESLVKRLKLFLEKRRE